jgi:hypothetical protein
LDDAFANDDEANGDLASTTAADVKDEGKSSGRGSGSGNGCGDRGLVSNNLAAL